MNLLRSPYSWFADELERRSAPKSNNQLDREATLALRDLRMRGDWETVKRICRNELEFVAQHETGVRYVDARRVRKA